MPYCFLKYSISLTQYHEISLKLWCLNHNNQESKEKQSLLSFESNINGKPLNLFFL